MFTLLNIASLSGGVFSARSADIKGKAFMTHLISVDLCNKQIAPKQIYFDIGDYRLYKQLVSAYQEYYRLYNCFVKTNCEFVSYLYMGVPCIIVLDERMNSLATQEKASRCIKKVLLKELHEVYNKIYNLRSGKTMVEDPKELSITEKKIQ